MAPNGLTCCLSLSIFKNRKLVLTLFYFQCNILFFISGEFSNTSPISYHLVRYYSMHSSYICIYMKLPTTQTYFCYHYRLPSVFLSDDPIGCQMPLNLCRHYTNLDIYALSPILSTLFMIIANYPCCQKLWHYFKKLPNSCSMASHEFIYR